MKLCNRTGWYLPDHEEHLQGWMTGVNARLGDRLTYQRHKYLAALKCVKRRGVAVDIGAHAALWSWQMAHDFGHVIAFEPMQAHADCFERNMADMTNWTLHRTALGPEEGEVWLRTRTANSSGDTGVEPSGESEGSHKAPLRTLDSYGLDDVDFVKIDCEGYELFVLQGAVETLLRCKPCVIVEQKPETGMEARYGIGTTDAVAFLEALGAVKRRGIQGDYIMAWPA